MGLFDFWIKRTTETPKEQRNSGVLSDLIPDASSSSGVNINDSNIMTISGVYAAVRTYSDTISSMPIHLIKEDGGNKERQYENPLYTLVAKEPNKIMTSFNWRQMLMSQLILKGNSYWYIDYDTSTIRPKQLIYLNPDKVEPKIVRDLMFYEIEFSNGTKTSIDQSNILHFRGLGDEIKGKSIIDFAKDNLSLGKAAEDFGSKFFKNGASISGVYEHPGQLSDKAYENLKKSLQNRTSPMSEKHKVLILEEGMKFTQTSIPPDSAQFLETRKFSISDISRWFKLPPHILYDMEKATFNNMEQQDLNFIKHSILPYLVNIEQELNRKLLREDEKSNHYFKFNMEGMLRGDIEARSKAYQLFIQNGIMSPNEARSKEDLDPYDGGDNKFMPINIAPIINGTNQQQDGETNN